MNYEYICQAYETYDIDEINFMLKQGWLLLNSVSMPKSGIKYSVGWDKRNGEVPKDKYTSSVPPDSPWNDPELRKIWYSRREQPIEEN